MTDKQAQYRPKFSRIWERYDEAAKDNAVHMREILEQALDALEAAERHIVITERVAGEKLEAAEKRIAEQQRSLDHREFLLLSADQVQREYAEALGCAGDNESILEAIDDMKKRIAELESRTVTDWIEHDGKWRPDSLSTDELVYLKTRKQELKIPYPAGKVKGWMHTGGDMDVMAYKLASPQASIVTAAAADVLAERQRQQSVEGWTPEHDDEHSGGEMALAASSYALYAHRKPIAPAFPYNWPWEPKWFKQQGARRDLVKAGALILAEIERIDRAAGIGEGE